MNKTTGPVKLDANEYGNMLCAGVRGLWGDDSFLQYIVLWLILWIMVESF